MFPKGTIYNIYNQRISGPHGEVYLHASRAVKFIYTCVRGLGAGMIGFVIITLLFTFGPLLKEEIAYRFYEPSQIDLVTAQNITAIQEEARKFGVNSYFSLVIPKINAQANVIANVNPASETEYTQALSKGVAHAQGTFFPGQGSTVFLFAHSTNQPFNVARYNAVFYLLDKLTAGDAILVYFADRRYIYQVTETKIVKPDATSYLTIPNSTPEEGGELLILQTCSPPGTSWNRLLVLAKPV